MASQLMMGSSSKILLCLILLSSTQFFSVDSHEFEVGDDKGWAVPTSFSKNDDDFYNDWASKKRFLVDDTVHFKYKKDSVLVVSDEEYEKCHSSHPIFFSNSGNTTYKLDHPGLFYFISGVSGHCQRGQRLIVKVLEQPYSPAPASQNGTSHHNGAAAAAPIAVAPLVVMSAMAAFFRFF